MDGNIALFKEMSNKSEWDSSRFIADTYQFQLLQFHFWKRIKLRIYLKTIRFKLEDAFMLNFKLKLQFVTKFYLSYWIHLNHLSAS